MATTPNAPTTREWATWNPIRAALDATPPAVRRMERVTAAL
jgi:hypothetical protein